MDFFPQQNLGPATDLYSQAIQMKAQMGQYNKWNAMLQGLTSSITNYANMYGQGMLQNYLKPSLSANSVAALAPGGGAQGQGLGLNGFQPGQMGAGGQIPSWGQGLSTYQGGF